MRRVLWVVAMLAAGCQCGTSPAGPDGSTVEDGGGGGGGGAGGGSGGGAGGGAGGGGGGVCTGIGATCSGSAECCSGVCQPDSTGTFRCASGAVCGAAGASCSLARDCCTLNCQGGACAAGLCLKTGESCSASDPGACCTGVCTGGQCVQPSGSACTVAGDSCPAAGPSSSCCSKVCVDYDPGAGTDLRCGAAGVCRSGGEPCNGADDCCSYHCGINGVCADPPVGGSCLVVGSACQALSDCCSGLCAADGTGFKVCQFLGGCRPEEELCRAEGDCCGVNSSSKGSDPVCELYPVGSVGRCRALSGDAPAGEVCEGSRNNTCAPNNNYCQESIAGIKRCAGVCDGGMCSETNCRGTGAACASPDDCCSRICAPGPDGGFICALSCLPLGGSCSTHADCCSTFCSPAGVCENPTLPDAGEPDGGSSCLPISASCTDSSQCCSQLCDPSTNRCIPMIN